MKLFGRPVVELEENIGIKSDSLTFGDFSEYIIPMVMIIISGDLDEYSREQLKNAKTQEELNRVLELLPPELIITIKNLGDNQNDK